MKRNVFILGAILSVFTFSMTSCISSEDQTSSNYGIYYTASQMGTLTYVSGDYTIYPSSTSLATVESSYKYKPKTGMSFIYYNYDPNSSSNANYSTTKKLYVDLVAAFDLNSTAETVGTKGDANDSIATAAIVGLQSPNGSSNGFFLDVDNGNTYLLTAVKYYTTLASSTLPLDNGHYMTLVYYPQETASGDVVMNLYLRHRSTDTKGSYLSSSFAGYVPSYYYKSFDITNFLGEYTNKSGNAMPQQIVIHTMENQESGILTDAANSKYTLTITAK